MVPTVWRLGLSGKEERDLGQKLTLGKHKSDGQEDQEKKGPTEEATSSWLQFYFLSKMVQLQRPSKDLVTFLLTAIFATGHAIL